MFRVLGILLLSLLPAGACIWDRDTLREEAKGKLDTVKAITGWFDRYPARYYEMRLERVARELESSPAALDLYDDAGVACDRLGRYDEAIAWMEKKEVQLASKPAGQTKVQRYRYLANRGSFLGNRWAIRPEKSRNADWADLLAAVECIDEAIKLNPDAHFGRERYQLKLFQWLEDGFNIDLPATRGFLDLQPTGSVGAGGLARAQQGDVEGGLVGLIQLGSAWESIDVLDALGTAVEIDGANSVGLLVSLRMRELKAVGQKSLYPRIEHRPGFHGLAVMDPAPLEAWYAKARKASDERNRAWIAYQTERFARGAHPDTHPDFWSGWKEPAFPEFPDAGRSNGTNWRK